MKQILFLIVPNGFRDEEYSIPKKILEENGFIVRTASTVTGALTGKRGLVTATVDMLISAVTVSDYAGVVVVGGQRTFWNDQTVISILQKMHAQGKVIGAICSSGVLPTQAGLLKPGQKTTAFSAEPEKKEIEKYGVVYTGAPVEIVDKIVTGRDADASEEFGQAVLKVLTA